MSIWHPSQDTHPPVTPRQKARNPRPCRGRGGNQAPSSGPAPPTRRKRRDPLPHTRAPVHIRNLRIFASILGEVGRFPQLIGFRRPTTDALDPTTWDRNRSGGQAGLPGAGDFLCSRGCLCKRSGGANSPRAHRRSLANVGARPVPPYPPLPKRSSNLGMSPTGSAVPDNRDSIRGEVSRAWLARWNPTAVVLGLRDRSRSTRKSSRESVLFSWRIFLPRAVCSDALGPLRTASSRWTSRWSPSQSEGRPGGGRACLPSFKSRPPGTMLREEPLTFKPGHPPHLTHLWRAGQEAA